MAQLKGDALINRYRITGTLKTASPLHIGTGEDPEPELTDAERKRLLDEIGKVPRVSTIITDHRKKPLIPGSTLRGVLRHWLLTVLQGAGAQWATTRDYAGDGLFDLTQDEQSATVRDDFSHLELLFGTPLNAGKIEVWDAPCTTNSLSIADRLLGWSPDRLTYVDTSVAIDPTTGTALDRLLYKAEVVPPGVSFEVSIVGQNLSETELGIVLLALEGFNSKIYPIHVGARSGRGYGRFEFALGDIYRLEQADLKIWLKTALAAAGTPGQADNAGYFGLKKLDAAEQKRLLNAVKSSFSAAMEG